MEEGKYDLGEFLSKKLLSFVNDESDLPSTSSHTYQNSSCNSVLSEDIDSLLLQAIENYEDSNEQASSTISRSFSDPVSGENIEQAIQNSIPESTKRDTKYCISMWNEWIVNRAKAAALNLYHIIISTCLYCYRISFYAHYSKTQYSL